MSSTDRMTEEASIFITSRPHLRLQEIGVPAEASAVELMKTAGVVCSVSVSERGLLVDALCHRWRSFDSHVLKVEIKLERSGPGRVCQTFVADPFPGACRSR